MVKSRKNLLILSFILFAATMTHAQQPGPSIAPAPVNLNFSSGVVGQVPPGWTVPPTRLTAGYKAELRRTGCRSGIGCAVILPPAKTVTDRDGVLWQRVSAGSYRGATVRLRGWVRLDALASGNLVQMSLRVNRGNLLQGFSDAMADRPIRSREWQLCEIVGKVADDAEFLDIGVTMVGRSQAWVDDVTLEIVDRNTPLTGAPPEKLLVPGPNAQPENLDFSRGNVGEVPAGWFVPPALRKAGYSAERRREGCRTPGGCAVVLVPSTPLKTTEFGNLMQSVSAASYKGRTLRFRAWLRLDSQEPNAGAQVWVRVDRTTREMGFFDNMGDRPVRSGAWQAVEIIGQVDDDAAYINFGVIVSGRGTAWIDGVTIDEVPPGTKATGQRQGSATGPVNLTFTDAAVGGVPRGWSGNAELRREGCWTGNLCAVVLPPADPALRFGNLMQTFIAAGYQGKYFRFGARLRLDATDQNDTAQLWLRVDRVNNQPGFFDNMSQRPVRDSGWVYCEIIGRVDEDAKYINFGVISVGHGKAWVDAIEFEILPPAAAAVK